MIKIGYRTGTEYIMYDMFFPIGVPYLFLRQQIGHNFLCFFNHITYDIKIHSFINTVKNRFDYCTIIKLKKRLFIDNDCIS